MTRLRREQIRDIGLTLPAYDAGLVRKTGLTLKQIAMQAAGLSGTEGLPSKRVAVVPNTSGQGIIEGFTEAVQEILNYVGVAAFQTSATDVAGFAEAIETGADIIFCADDQRFVAVQLTPKKLIDNAEATARGYVEALHVAAKGLRAKPVLVIGGAGKVGWNAVLKLTEKGARVAICDTDRDRLTWRLKGREFRVEENFERALTKYRLLFDASPAADLIRAEHVTEETLIAAPGIPLGVAEQAIDRVQDRLIHDPLQIGVATMLFEAFSEEGEKLNHR